MKRIALPRDAVVDRMLIQINGTSEPNRSRFGHLDRDRAMRTLDVWKGVVGNPMTEDQMDESLRKSVSQAPRCGTVSDATSARIPATRRIGRR
jgi:hypothetical protein